MPDRTPIDGPQKSARLCRPASGATRPRSGDIVPDPMPARDSKQFTGVGRKSSRLRRLDSRGSPNK